jgi:hypothetical protein
LPLKGWQGTFADIGAVALVAAAGVGAWIMLLALIVVASSFLAAAISKVNVTENAFWPFTLLMIPVIFFVFSGIVLFTCDLAGVRLFRRLTNQDLLLRTTGASIASVVFTGIACVVSAKFFSGGAETYWFNKGGWPDQGSVFILAGSNFLFDMIAILSALISLRVMASSRAWFFPLAAANIGVAAVTSIVLRVLLDMISGPSLTGFVHVKTAAAWLLKIATLQLGSSDPGWQLTPVLLTTFIPISIYMLALMSLSALKPIAATIRYLCGLLSEKKNSPFLELGTIMALILGLAKALTDWPWMIRVISHLPL